MSPDDRDEIGEVCHVLTAGEIAAGCTLEEARIVARVPGTVGELWVTSIRTRDLGGAVVTRAGLISLGAGKNAHSVQIRQRQLKATLTALVQVYRSIEAAQ